MRKIFKLVSLASIIALSTPLFCSSTYVGVDIENDKRNILSLCQEDGYSLKTCECAYNKTLKEINIEAVIYVDNNIETFEEDSIEYRSGIELLSDYDMIFIMNIEKCIKD